MTNSTERTTHSLTPHPFPPLSLDSDTFGLTVCSLVRDGFYLAEGIGKWHNRYFRLATTLFLLVLCTGIQVFLLTEVKRFVSAKAVHDVRVAYDQFENIMYDGHTWILSERPIIERRGIGGKLGPHFNASRFDDLAPDQQSAVCRIPLSQPWFFFFVLYIWTLTVVREIRHCKVLFDSVVLHTPTISSMRQSLKQQDEEADLTDISPMVVVGLPRATKAALVFVVILPRFVVAMYLLWLGCRWLLATTDFSDLLQNAVALELLLNLKELLYMAVVPQVTVLSVENLGLAQGRPKESGQLFFGTVTWAAIAAVWVLLYMGVRDHDGWQMVLRVYQWDVHDICSEWIARRYAD